MMLNKYAVYNLDDVMKNVYYVSKANWKKLLLFFVGYVIVYGFLLLTYNSVMSVLLSTFNLLRENFSIEKRYIPLLVSISGMFMIMLFLYSFIDGILAIFIFDQIKEQDTSKGSQIEFTLKNSWLILTANLLNMILIVFSIFLFNILIVIPIVNIVASVALTGGLLYYFGYYRFTPYIAYFYGSLDSIYRDARGCINLVDSIVVLIIRGIILGIGLILIRPYISHPTSIKEMFIIFITVFLSLAMHIFFKIIDLSFVTTAVTLKKHHNQVIGSKNISSSIDEFKIKVSENPKQVFYDI